MRIGQSFCTANGELGEAAEMLHVIDAQLDCAAGNGPGCTGRGGKTSENAGKNAGGYVSLGEASLILREQVTDIMRSGAMAARLKYPEEYYDLCWQALAVVLQPGEVVNWWDMQEAKRAIFRTFINEVKHS